MTSEEHHEEKAARLRRLLRGRGCCFRHLRLLLEESVGLPFSALTHVNFLYCSRCRAKPLQINTDHMPSISSSSSSAIASWSSSPCFLDTFFHEYSAAVASKAAKRALTEYPAADSCKRPSLTRHTLHAEESSDGADVEDDDVLTMAPPTKASTIESIPLHLLFGDAVLSHLPLCDIACARFVSRGWMAHIDRALQDPTSCMHPCLRYPCLMLLHPCSAKTGAGGALSVYDVGLNTWLPNAILFPSNASFLVGASLGLFCFATCNPLIDRNADLYVGNPLVHAWTCLPRTPVLKLYMPKLMHVTFTASQSSPNGVSYKLLKLFRTEDMYNGITKLFMYDSNKGEWDKLHGRVTLQPEMLEHVLLEDPWGLLYLFDAFMHRFWSYDLYTNKVLETHRLEGNTSHVSAELVHAMQEEEKYYLPPVMGLPTVVKCAERLFRVCRMERIFRYEPRAVVGLIPLIYQCWPIEIFRLDYKTRWEMVSKMPPDLLREAVERGSDGTDFVIGSDRTQHLFFILRGSSVMLAYDVLSSEWKTLPGCPGGQSFYPYRLHAFYEPLMCQYTAPPHINNN